MTIRKFGHFGRRFHPERIDLTFVRPIPGPYIEERRRLRHQRPRYDVSRLGVLGELVEFIYDTAYEKVSGKVFYSVTGRKKNRENYSFIKATEEGF